MLHICRRRCLGQKKEEGEINARRRGCPRRRAGTTFRAVEKVDAKMTHSSEGVAQFTLVNFSGVSEERVGCCSSSTPAFQRMHLIASWMIS
jgi:hypothetical protein